MGRRKARHGRNRTEFRNLGELDRLREILEGLPDGALCGPVGPPAAEPAEHPGDARKGAQRRARPRRGAYGAFGP